MRGSLPSERKISGPVRLGETMGSSTGEDERAVQAGGWAGTDDATSTAPSDELGNPPRAEEEKAFSTITRDFDDSIQRDGEQQEQSAQEVDEQSERNDHSETLRPENKQNHERVAT
jgi:hypothetical protein